MNLIKSTGTFSFFVIVSRLLGYLRDVLIAIYLGSGPIADAFFVAFRIPNTFRRLFSEGSFNAAFVPSYSAEIVKGKSKAQNFANDIFNFLMLGLLLLVILIEIFMPGFIYIIAPGFYEDQNKLETTILLTRIIFPFLLFISLASFFSAILNSHNKFGVAAAAPIILNLILILVIYLEKNSNDNLVIYMSYSVSIAGIVQLVFVYLFTKKYFRPTLNFKLKLTKKIKKFFIKFLPGVFSSGVPLKKDPRTGALSPTEVANKLRDRQNQRTKAADALERSLKRKGTTGPTSMLPVVSGKGADAKMPGMGDKTYKQFYKDANVGKQYTPPKVKSTPKPPPVDPNVERTVKKTYNKSKVTTGVNLRNLRDTAKFQRRAARLSRGFGGNRGKRAAVGKVAKFALGAVRKNPLLATGLALGAYGLYQANKTIKNQSNPQRNASIASLRRLPTYTYVNRKTDKPVKYEMGTKNNPYGSVDTATSRSRLKADTYNPETNPKGKLKLLQTYPRKS